MLTHCIVLHTAVLIARAICTAAISINAVSWTLYIRIDLPLPYMRLHHVAGFACPRVTME